MPNEALVQLMPPATPGMPSPRHAGMPLPEELRHEVRVNWYMTKWCNYSCGYCPVLVFHKKTKTEAQQEHAFDYYPVQQWLTAFDALPYPQVSIHLTGGEVFLDRANLNELLQGLTSRDRINTIGIATNAFWDPAHYNSFDKSKIFLDIGLHPSQTNLDDFRRRVQRIRDAGFQIAIVNYVVSPENMDMAEDVVELLTKDGLCVLVSTMFPTGNYLSRDYRTDRELEILVKYNTPLDLKYKLIRPDVKNHECFYPAMNYYLLWDGRVQVNCMTTYQNLFDSGFPELPRQSVPCPHAECIGCTDMYRTLVDEPLYPRPPKLFTHLDLAHEVTEYRREAAFRAPAEIAAQIDSYRSAINEIRKHNYEVRAAGVVAPAAIPVLPPNQDLFGYMDSAGGNFYAEGLSTGRIILGGWMASARHGAPLSAVTIRVRDKTIATIREFYARPDVSAHFGRPDWLMSGWLSMVYLPVLPVGEHSLSIGGIDPDGVETHLTTWPLRITG